MYADDDVPAPARTRPCTRRTRARGGWTVEAYGPAKVACEEACVEAMGSDHCALARAGLIVGYGDRSDRFGYWPARVARAADGEPVLVPPRDARCQVIDVEDLAAGWCTSPSDARAGAFNALGDVTTVGAVLDACDAARAGRPRCVEVTDGWLAEQEVAPWSGPGVPAAVAAPAGVRRVHDPPQRRRDALRVCTLRPVARHRRGGLRWERERGLDRDRRAGLTPAREARAGAQPRADSESISMTVALSTNR